MESSQKKLEKLSQCSVVFSPSAPIDDKSLFAGRINQLVRLAGVVNTTGQHGAIFGERGVGKTSLANILRVVIPTLTADASFTIRVNCSKGESFEQLWRKAFDEVIIDQDTGGASYGLLSKPESHPVYASSLLPDGNVSPSTIRRLLSQMGKCVIIFDEFDRTLDGSQAAKFTDLLKELSDHALPATIFLVGVADSVDSLIAEHASIDRNLKQVHIPRMNAEELEQIVKTASKKLELPFKEDAVNLISQLSLGLPHYTHLIGKASAEAAIRQNVAKVTRDQVRTGMKSAIADADQSIRKTYQTATMSPRRDTLFEPVLLACALAPVDDLGYFAAADVRKPLSAIMKREYDIPGFSQHLDKFSSEDRGNVLVKAGPPRRFRFRFRNPLLQPYVVMNGVEKKLIEGTSLDKLHSVHSR